MAPFPAAIAGMQSPATIGHRIEPVPLALHPPPHRYPLPRRLTMSAFFDKLEEGIEHARAMAIGTLVLLRAPR